MVIRHVAPVSAAKVFAMIYAVIGLLFGAMFTFIGSMGGSFLGAMAGPLQLGSFLPFLGVAAIIILPILYACIGFVGTLLVAALYNMAAGLVGGLEIDIEPRTDVA